MAGEPGMVTRLEIRRRAIGVNASPGEYLLQQVGEFFNWSAYPLKGNLTLRKKPLTLPRDILKGACGDDVYNATSQPTRQPPTSDRRGRLLKNQHRDSLPCIRNQILTIPVSSISTTVLD